MATIYRLSQDYGLTIGDSLLIPDPQVNMIHISLKTEVSLKCSCDKSVLLFLSPFVGRQFLVHTDRFTAEHFGEWTHVATQSNGVHVYPILFGLNIPIRFNCCLFKRNSFLLTKETFHSNVRTLFHLAYLLKAKLVGFSLQHTQ